MNANGEDELKGLLKAACKPVVASPEFRERLLRRLTQEVSRQSTQSPKPSGQPPVVWLPMDAYQPVRKSIAAELVSTSRV